MNDNNVKHFNSFRDLEYIAKEIKNFIDNKNIMTNINLQPYASIKYGYVFNGFIDFACKGKSLKDFTDLFSPSNIKNNKR